MKKIVVVIQLFLVTAICHAQDPVIDISALHPSCASLEHLVPLLTIQGKPQVQKEGDSVSVIINHGYCIGFSSNQEV